MPPDPLDLRVRELLEETAAASVTPAGGAAAAVAVGLAAALTAMAARFGPRVTLYYLSKG